MASISKLSDEILLIILSFFGHWTTKPVLCKIALVSRRLYQLSTLCLMEDIFLTPFRAGGSCKKYDQLLSALKSNEHIGTKVRKLDIDWSSQKARDDLQILLHRLTNVRYLTIQAYSRQDFDYKIYVAPPSSCCKYKLSISLNEPNNEDIRNLLVHCHVHDLDIKVLGIRDLPAISPPTTKQAQTTVLRSLKCNDQNTAAISTENLRNILLYPKALNDLSMQIPGLRERNLRSNTQMMRNALSPQAILDALSPTSRTLQSLEVDGIADDFPSHDGSQLCLFDFQALKSAFLSSSLILPPHESWPNLPNLLPSSLCALTILVDPNQYLPPGSAWLLELAKRKTEKTPLLSSLTLRSASGRSVDFICGTLGEIEWSQMYFHEPEPEPILPAVDSLEQNFHDVGIHFEVQGLVEWRQQINEKLSG